MSDSTPSSLPRATCWWDRPRGDVEIHELPGVGPALVYAGPTEPYDALANSTKLLESAVGLDLTDPEKVRAFAQDWGPLGLPTPAWPAGAGLDGFVERLGAWQVELGRFQRGNDVWLSVRKRSPEQLAFLEQWHLHDFGTPLPDDEAIYDLALAFFEDEVHRSLGGLIVVESEVRETAIHMTTHVKSLFGAIWVAMTGPLVERTCVECGQRFFGSNPTRKYCGDGCRKGAWEPNRGQ